MTSTLVSMTPVNAMPFNLNILNISDEDVKNIRPITAPDIFDGFSKNFHPSGLFSVETFGRVGEERRNRLFSYISLNIEIFHPTLFQAIVELKSLYQDILSGNAYAVFDETINDFVKSDPVNGQTGFEFFVKYFKKIDFEARPSYRREFNIKLVTKYKHKALMDKLVVIPAGLRDYVVDENGKPSEDDINNIYRKILSISNVISTIDTSINVEYIDNMRYNLQMEVINIYNYIKNLLEGKSKLVLGKWATRAITNSTRNVITSYVPRFSELGGHRHVSKQQTVVGLYQFLRATLPLAQKQLREGFLSKVFVGPNSPAVLVDSNYKKKLVNVDSKYFDDWMTNEGLEKMFARYGQENLRHSYLKIDDYYIGLMFLGNDGTYKFIQDKDEVPDKYKDDCTIRPITYTELLMLSVFHGSEKISCFMTRYPITGYGSIYPSYVYLKSTVKSEIRRELDDFWEPTDITCAEFPVLNGSFYNSLSPSTTHIGRAGADKMLGKY
jgi:hypothetical protein